MTQKFPSNPQADPVKISLVFLMGTNKLICMETLIFRPHITLDSLQAD